MNKFSIAADLPSLKLWQGKEDGDGKPLSPAVRGTVERYALHFFDL